jgi:tRNA nucleotidyltransferase/poly(A) polymerase
MNHQYSPKKSLEKFGAQVYDALVDNFPQTYFVGGMVRDMLLNKKIHDIDLATEATPDQVVEVLQNRRIKIDASHRRFGVITAQQGIHRVEVATFRQDLAAPHRYPEVRFVKSPRSDSSRRDFTVNALYYDFKTGRIHDFHKGLGDLKKRQLKFIGNPARRVAEDPLRIIRALRFQLQLKFGLEKNTEQALQKHFSLANKLSQQKIAAEISKLPALAQQKSLRRIINSYHLTLK